MAQSTIYELIRDLIHNGIQEEQSKVELPIIEIVKELEMRTGLLYGSDFHRWATWFRSEESKGSDMEKENIRIMIILFTIKRRLDKI